MGEALGDDSTKGGRTSPVAPHTTAVDDEVATPGPDNGENVPLGQVPPACPLAPPASQQAPPSPPVEAHVHDDGQGELSMAPQGLKRGMAEALGDDSTKGGRTTPVAPHTTANVDEDDDEGGEDERESGDE